MASFDTVPSIFGCWQAKPPALRDPHRTVRRPELETASGVMRPTYMKTRWLGPLIVMAALAGCTREDDETARRKLEKTRQELKQDTREAAEKLRKGMHEAGQELKKDAHEASQEIKKATEKAKEDLR